jgi:hypothetical protein
VVVKINNYFTGELIHVLSYPTRRKGSLDHVDLVHPVPNTNFLVAVTSGFVTVWDLVTATVSWSISLASKSVCVDSTGSGDFAVLFAASPSENTEGIGKKPCVVGMPQSFFSNLFFFSLLFFFCYCLQGFALHCLMSRKQSQKTCGAPKQLQSMSFLCHQKKWLDLNLS